MSKQKAPKKEEIITGILEILIRKNPQLDVDQEKKRLKELGRPAGGKEKLVGILKDLQCGVSVTSAGKLAWDGPMIEILLNLRLQKYLKVFEGSKSIQQRSLAWEKILYEFNLGIMDSSDPTRRARDSKQLRDKFVDLKKIFIAVRLAEEEIGHDVEKTINYPENWDVMVNYFGEKTALGNHEVDNSEIPQRPLNGLMTSAERDSMQDEEYAEQEPIVNEHEDYDLNLDQENTTNLKRKQIVQHFIEKQRKESEEYLGKRRCSAVSNERARQELLREGLVELGTILKNGMIEAAKIAANHDMKNLIDAAIASNAQQSHSTELLIAEMKSWREEIKAFMEGQSQINAYILKLLQAGSGSDNSNQ